MPELILHHYDVSPFSEKIRKILAFKRIPWRGVQQPMVAPKPKLTPLTGGYRRTPVLQIGAEVVCDTAAIAEAIEARHPEPTLFPEGTRAAARAFAHWADHWMFRAVVPPTIVNLLPMLPPEFLADREALSPGFSRAALEQALPVARGQLVEALDWLAEQLDERPFLLGETFSLADAACFHVLWFLRNSPEDFQVVTRRPALHKWFEHLDGLGSGDMTPLDADEALAIARGAEPDTRERSDGSDPIGIAPGDAITVTADDYGMDPVSGTAVIVTARAVALRRQHDEVGDVVVHFPRIGYGITRT